MKRFHLIVVLFCIGIFISSVFYQKTKSECFIISEKNKQKKLSKNCLKESIGANIKKLLYNCVELNKQIGKLQQEISDIEKSMFKKVEQLIDNKKPFKKAEKKNLSHALQIMQDVNGELFAQLCSLGKIMDKLKTNNCLKKAAG